MLEQIPIQLGILLSIWFLRKMTPGCSVKYVVLKENDKVDTQCVDGAVECSLEENGVRGGCAWLQEEWKALVV